MVRVEHRLGLIGMESAETKVKLWEELPWEVLMNILAHLPLEDVVGARCVCRSWRNLTSCRLFHDFWTWAGSRTSHLIVRYRYASRKASRCYSTTNKRWYVIPNSFFMPKGGFLVEAARGGLAAIRTKDKIAVGNPITDEWTLINPPRKCSWQKESWAILGINGKHFKLLIGSKLYDTARSSWFEMNIKPQPVQRELYCDQNGYLYYMQQSHEGLKLLRSCLDYTEAVGTAPGYAEYGHIIFNYKGEIGLISQSGSCFHSVTAYVLDVLTGHFKEKAVLPEEMAESIVKKQDEYQMKMTKGGHYGLKDKWQFVVCNGQVVIAPFRCSDLIVFDCLEETWHWIEDPVEVYPFERPSPLFCLQLTL